MRPDEISHTITGKTENALQIITDQSKEDDESERFDTI